MSQLSRRTFLAVGAGLAHGAVAPVAALAAPAPASRVFFNVKDFGAMGDGRSDDAPALNAASAAAAGGGTVWFPPGTYLISSPVVLKGRCTYRGSSAQASRIRQRDGANLHALLIDEGYLKNFRTSSRGVQIEDLWVDGSRGSNIRGHGIILMSYRSLVRHVTVSDTPESGIVFSDTTISGRLIDNTAVENRVESCSLLRPGQRGIWIKDTRASGRMTDGYILNTIVQAPEGDYAMRIERAAGWFIRENHVYSCAQGGYFLGAAWATFFCQNEVDGYGKNMFPGTVYGVNISFLLGRGRPSLFMGNLCATAESRQPSNQYVYFRLYGNASGPSHAVLVGNTAHNDAKGQPLAVGHGVSSVGFQLKVQHGGELNVQDVGNASQDVLSHMTKGRRGVALGGDSTTSSPTTSSPTTSSPTTSSPTTSSPSHGSSLFAGGAGAVAGAVTGGGAGLVVGRAVAPTNGSTISDEPVEATDRSDD